MFNKSTKVLLPGLGIVFGSVVGLLVSVLCSFDIVTCMISGAAVGLLIGIISSILFGKSSGVKGRD